MMRDRALLICSFICSLFIGVKPSGECFSCMSNPNWSYYAVRIPGLKSDNSTLQPPLAPLACTFDPMRAYADGSAVACKGQCFKWTSATILEDGGLEVNILRGCHDNLIDDSHETKEGTCYQEPHDYSHKVGVEYKSMCYCKGFMCNAVTSLSTVIPFLITILGFGYDNV